VERLAAASHEVVGTLRERVASLEKGELGTNARLKRLEVTVDGHDGVQGHNTRLASVERSNDDILALLQKRGFMVDMRRTDSGADWPMISLVAGVALLATVAALLWLHRAGVL
jgi:hypothetical protein